MSKKTNYFSDSEDDDDQGEEELFDGEEEEEEEEEDEEEQKEMRMLVLEKLKDENFEEKSLARKYENPEKKEKVEKIKSRDILAEYMRKAVEEERDKLHKYFEAFRFYVDVKSVCLVCNQF